MNPLDALHCPLDGVNLIEASAGTGKTWTIAALYTRLLLEPGADGTVPGIDQVLVVTYTKAATAELRSRLRHRLRELQAVLDGAPCDDPFLAALAERHPAGPARARALARLNAAIVGFDTAAIYTIHGFCQRALTDAAFESGQSFSAELIQDDGERLLDAVVDFWRVRLCGDALLARTLEAAGETPESWLAEIRPHLAKPYLQLARPAPTHLPAARAALEAAWRQVAADPAAVAGALDLFARAEGLNARSFGPGQRAQTAAALTRLVALPDAVPTLSRDERKWLERLTPAALAKGCNKGATPPAHPLFAGVADWLAAWDRYSGAAALEVAGLKLDLIDRIGIELERRRREERQRSFDDLLIDLDQALRAPGRGEALARRLADSFRVALIDEFQDTDPTQYHIFRSCFVEQGRPVFLVGDPKQAIYSFRGADVFAYLDARTDSQAQYTLDTNRRSLPALVDAVNTLFARSRPFVLPDIGYQPVSAAPADGGLEIDDDRQPCTWQWLDFAATRKGASKQLAAESAAAAAAGEIARLLGLARSGAARLRRGTAVRPLIGGDIAVLVSTHRQGDLVRDALAAHNVPCVALTQDSVYASREAAALQALLSAWAEPASEGRLRRLLATELCGLDAAALLAAEQREADWEALLARMAEDHQRWLSRGFMAAWRQFFARERLAERLLPLPDGERRLTNLAHLAELLQKESETRSGIAPLIEWFEQQIAVSAGGEEALLRLESDASLVKIVTVHSAKGLQYPVVFCPFLWDGALGRREPAFWRARRDGGTWLMPAALADDDTVSQAQREMLSEKLRLAYVALTRAQYRQYIAWGWVQGMETAALSWLLHAPDGVDRIDDLPALTDAGVRDDLARLVAAPGLEASLIVPQPEPALAPDAREAGRYRARILERPLYTPWRVASFSGLVSHGSAERERPDHDRGALALPAIDDGATPRFPRGARAGTCLHAVMERIDFTVPLADQQAIVAEALRQHGFDQCYQPAAIALVGATLAAPLDAGVSLGRVPQAERLTELEFTMPVGRLRVEALRALLAEPASGLDPAVREAAARLDFATVRGFLKGFIDLVCRIDGRYYLIDYKSNDLGVDDGAYGRAALAGSIAREHYYLQYLIYCVALRRYLAGRGVDFDACFAGVRYLYMRGLGTSGDGVWSDRPSGALLDALDALFAA